MATARDKSEQAPASADFLYHWEGKDKHGKQVRGELYAGGNAAVKSTLQRQGIWVTRVKRKRFYFGQNVSEKDIALFTRQLTTMLKAGVPLLKAFDIVGKGQTKMVLTRLIQVIREDVETGTSLHQAFRRHPRYFDALYCSLIHAGEQAGMLDNMLASLSTYKEKVLAIKGKVRSAMIYPLAIMAFALTVTAVILIWVVPSFQEVFRNMGADLPTPTLVVVAVSEFLIRHGPLALAILLAGVWITRRAIRRSPALQSKVDKFVLKLPIFGTVLSKVALARWCRTLATMFSAGVPLVDALEPVGAASGSAVYASASKTIQSAVSSGSSLTTAMENTRVFPSLVSQMASIGEESGSLDQMLSKVADFYEIEVDDAINALTSLMEPFMMLVLGVLIGGLVIAMYLPIFKLGSVV